MKLKMWLIHLTYLMIVLSCNKSNSKQKIVESTDKFKQYSTLFSVSEDRKTITISYPEHPSLHIVFDSIAPKNFQRNDTIFIVSQPKKIVCSSTTFLGFLKVINETNSIVGFQNKNLVYDSVLYLKLEHNLIQDVSTPEGVNTELLLAMQPDIVFLSYSPGFEKTNMIERMKNNGIIIIQIPDWLEQHPLGRMEWVRFFSLFFNKFEEATRYTDSVISVYNDVKMHNLTKSYAPKVMVGLSFNDQWYVPSGNGYFGTLLKDAGFSYPFQNITTTMSKPYSKEEVLEQCHDAEFWLNVTTANTLKAVEQIERLAPQFKAFQQKNVFNYTRKLLPRGANDFWEMGVVEPHIVLQDVVWIISKKKSNYQPKYYQQLQ